MATRYRGQWVCFTAVSRPRQRPRRAPPPPRPVSNRPRSTPSYDQVAEHEAAGRRVALVKSAVDTRYARAWVVTHRGRRARCFAAPTLAAFREELGPLLGRFHVGGRLGGAGGVFCEGKGAAERRGGAAGAAERPRPASAARCGALAALPPTLG
jgi:hypothetical protein